ncbi:putative membrane-bound acid phosphatase 2 [Leptomonas pyrrhocoris]|uniref:Putative membrane-bound acid phosphatase 2 n=1 Tax=Leptomonas pyrrhocoris TaxID=157538 RepID=A0A0N0DW33_LEPPY|nr:putative membrane-bound acid phosphatase 2 [Leptomonas pyrrhocoris]XP_015659653.1 putative membrane-bound acid phosphatase 2 [Leptomonas pyrrhocoris]XP_015660407.1 putative membrane-bound acid phosphatase 2 [Leptomonas pyrrhocoris]XP_015660408.1 putative membrane-bound acid phosphatase 2 [Leptomonas pyrrhocoris]XP_015660409.1 putative membrane-bound acid phosphatase 2 [Leptomonas pyrrhocoris]KPA81213.1 putative membrane-bound acid phosphatase 2 [Leptomonas pyrrhocoris]KPA81214.1 putative m|eukprot:XP_015659652.1 putative membrane-bound acid phosphatase 2 [Leptomonas pyrrhocoris]
MTCVLRLTLVATLVVALVALSAAYAKTDSVAASSGLSSSAEGVDLEVVLVQVLHRHGARAGTPRFNTSDICTEAPCGYLTWAGVKMLLNTGAYLRKRYNEDTTVVNTPLFPSPSYNLDVSYSRSSDVLRTLQSAEAFLRGFFPNTTSLYAAIHTVAEATDILLNSNVQPWLKFFYSNNKPLLHKVCNPLTDKLYPDWTEITKIGKEVFLEGFCNVYETRSDCVRTLFDIAAAKMAVGELDKFPLLKANYQKIQSITRVLFAYEYHYDHTDPLMFKQGGRGQPFLKQLVQNMDNQIAGTNTYKLMHYSGHDTTLAPVWGTLGDESDTAMLPPFAQIMVVELLKSKSTGAEQVRVLRGAPGQSPDTNFVFDWDNSWNLRCMNSWGATYIADGHTCPFEDFKRYIRWSEPGDARGYCFLDPDSVAIANCPSGNSAYGPLSSTCQSYRAACPSFACTNGYTLDGASYQCVCSTDSCLGGTSTRATTRPGTAKAKGAASAKGTADQTKMSHNSGLSAGAVVGVSLGTFCVGAVIAVAVTTVVCVCAKRRHQNATTKHGFVALDDGRSNRIEAREEESA